MVDEQLGYEILRALDDSPAQTDEELVRTLEGAGLKVSLDEVKNWLSRHERSLVLWEARGEMRWKLTPGGRDRLTELAP